MAIKERKQITGTEAQIKGYAGHNGVLAYATDTEHLHVLSGTAGTTTELANMSDIPAPVDISGKADKTYVDTELTKKQPNGDYATNTALTQGLAGKADSSHMHTINDITGFQDFLDDSNTKLPNIIPKAGSRGVLAGYEQWTKAGATTTLTVYSGDSVLLEPAGAAVTIDVQAGTAGQIATKFVWVTMSNKSITINGTVGWWGGPAPTINKSSAVLLFFFHDEYVECRLIGQWDES